MILTRDCLNSTYYLLWGQVNLKLSRKLALGFDQFTFHLGSPPPPLSRVLLYITKQRGMIYANCISQFPAKLFLLGLHQWEQWLGDWR